ncbi:MAG: InlB B-repeat-containing protein [Methanomassiliicoccaceae archaeon]|nr:InlB B-repeat-containing protein [Methanomassiliicoccaceae archaeon]
METKRACPKGREKDRSRIFIAAIAVTFLMIVSAAFVLSGNNDDDDAYVLGAGDVDISSCTSANDVKTAIEAEVAITADGQTVKVVGSLSGITDCLALNIGKVNIDWCADYEAAVASGNVLEINSGGGWFVVTVDGTDEGKMTLTGDVNVTGDNAGFAANYDGEVSVDGDVTVISTPGTDLSVHAYYGGMMSITGDVNVSGDYVQVYGAGSGGITSTLEIGGDVIASGNSVFISASDTAGVLNIGGNVTVTGTNVSVFADGNACAMEIDGNLSVTATGGGAYVYAYGLNTTFEIGGNVTVASTGDDAMVYAYGNGTVFEIDGDVSVTAAGGNTACVCAEVNGKLIVSGDVTAADGIYLSNEGFVIIHGMLYVADEDECLWYDDGSGNVPVGLYDLVEGGGALYPTYLYFGDAAAGEFYLSPGAVPKFTVTYDANTGTGAVPTETDKIKGATFTAADSTLTAPAGTRFLEWNTEADGSGDSYAEGDTVTMPAANLTLYATWETVYTVTYDANGGSGTVPTESDKAPGETFTTAVSAITAPAGMQLAEWNTEADGSGDSYAEGQTVTMPAANLTLYAIWENVYTVSYDVNGGTGTIAPEPGKTKGVSIVVKDITGVTAPEGKQFKEWNTAADGSGTSYAPGTVVAMPDDDLVLYATWEDVPEDSGLNVGLILIIAAALLLVIVAVSFMIAKRS